MRYPGEVWYLPPEARAEGDPKWRRHVLLTPCAERGDSGVVAYATTSSLEVRHGAAAFLLDPGAGEDPHPGFTRPTWIAPYRLVPALSEQMRRKAGRIVAALPEIRRKLRRAIGVGTGTGIFGYATGSLRGFVAELSADVAEECGARFTVIVTEPGYSLARRYQLVLPLVSASDYDREDSDLLLAGREWIRQVTGRSSDSFLANPRYVQTAFEKREIARILPIVVDADTIGEIDTAIARYFEL